MLLQPSMPKRLAKYHNKTLQSTMEEKMKAFARGKGNMNRKKVLNRTTNNRLLRGSVNPEAPALN